MLYQRFIIIFLDLDNISILHVNHPEYFMLIINPIQFLGVNYASKTNRIYFCEPTTNMF